jgi:hypothetical protein
MNPIKLVLFSGWVIWFAVYFRFSWKHGQSPKKRMLKIAFPIFLFIENSWPLGTEIQRMKIQLGAMALVIATAVIESIEYYAIAS